MRFKSLVKNSSKPAERKEEKHKYLNAMQLIRSEVCLLVTGLTIIFLSHPLLYLSAVC